MVTDNSRERLLAELLDRISGNAKKRTCSTGGRSLMNRSTGLHWSLC